MVKEEKMLGSIRLPYTVLYRMCNTWKGKLCVFVCMLALLSFSVFSIHSLHHSRSGSRVYRYKDAPSDNIPASWLFSGSSVFNNEGGTLENDGSTTTRRNPSSRRPRELVPCSNLTNDTPRGPIEADITSVPRLKQLESSLSMNLLLGGKFVPKDCIPTQRIAVIVPFRDRDVHLKMFLRHMHPFLQRQKVEYYIVVVEQSDGEPFNRALLFNIGYYKMNKLHEIDCYIFHDVDLLPLDDRNLYQCQDQPLHLSMLVDTLGDKLMYDYLFGGVVALTPKMMEEVNGFSNFYFGWGGEDDDMSYRIRSNGYSIDRYSKEVSRYTMMKHGRDEDVNQYKLNRKVEAGKDRILNDGLSSLEFRLLEFQPLPLYTWIYIKPNSSMEWNEDKRGKEKD